MSQIKSRWTKPERIVHNWLKGNKIKHKMHPKITGNPDILVYPKTLIFIDGCFWHKCPKCFRKPNSKLAYWEPKIENNIKRDKAITRKLKKHGYKVVRIWEHELTSLKSKNRIYRQDLF